MSLKKLSDSLKSGRHPRRKAVTLLELLAVVLIVSILATIGTNTYIGQLKRARIAATSALIRELSIAIARYEVDTGLLPPSGSADLTFSGTTISSIATPTLVGFYPGSSLLHLTLVHSVSGSATQPADPTWHGPYMDFQAPNISFDETTNRTQILDAFGNPINYMNANDYSTSPFSATEMFDGSESTNVSNNANPNLPSPNPYAATETFYNVSTYQIYSFGPDETTFSATGERIYAGTQLDDINNFGY